MNVGFSIFILVVICIALCFLGFIYAVICAISDHIASCWLKKRDNEIQQEFSRNELRLGTGDYVVLPCITAVGYYIKTVHERNKPERRTKVFSKYRFRSIIFKMYNTPCNEVMEKLFTEYEDYIHKKEVKQNKELFSDNKYKRAVKFKTEEKEDGNASN